jgi:hypothetical protein
VFQPGYHALADAELAGDLDLGEPCSVPGRPASGLAQLSKVGEDASSRPV